jgi:hypothetical protein
MAAVKQVHAANTDTHLVRCQQPERRSIARSDPGQPSCGCAMPTSTPACQRKPCIGTWACAPHLRQHSLPPRAVHQPGRSPPGIRRRPRSQPAPAAPHGSRWGHRRWRRRWSEAARGTAAEAAAAGGAARQGSWPQTPPGGSGAACMQVGRITVSPLQRPLAKRGKLIRLPMTPPLLTPLLIGRSPALPRPLPLLT